MSNLPPENPSPREPDSTTREKQSIRKSQDEFVDDIGTPSMDKKEYEERQGHGSGDRPQTGKDDSAASRH